MSNFTQQEFDRLTQDDLLKNVFVLDSNGKVCMRVLMIGQNIINWWQVGWTLTDQVDLKAALDALTTAVGTKLNANEKWAASGVAPLGADSKIPTSYLPSIVFNDIKAVADIAARDAISTDDRNGLIVKVADRGDGKPANYMWDLETLGWIQFADVNDVISVNGQTGVVSLNTSHISESTNLYFTEARVRATVLTGFSVGTNTAIVATDSILVAMGKIQAQINAKEPTIAAGTTAQFWRGDKAWTDFATTVRAAVLTGLSLASAAAVTAADSILVAIGKLQKQNTDQDTAIALKSNLAGGNTFSGTQIISGTGKLITVGDDSSIYDINVSNSARWAGEQDSTQFELQLGTGWGKIKGNTDGTLTLTGYAAPTEVITTPVEATLAVGDMIGLMPDWVWKIATEVNTSAAIGGTLTAYGSCRIDATRMFHMYLSGTTQVYGVIASLSGDTISYGTPFLLATVASAGSGGCALLTSGTIVVSWKDGAAAFPTVNFNSAIVSFSGTTISSIGTTHVTGVGVGGTFTGTIYSVARVRDTAFAIAVATQANQNLFVHTVSGTTITTGTNVAGNGSFSGWPMVVWLQDNRIAYCHSDATNSNTMIGRIFEINPAGSNATTTYTTSGNGSQGYIARLTASEFVFTNDGNTNLYIYGIPGAGTVLTATALPVNAAAWYGVVPIADNIFWVATGSSMLIYNRDIFKRTISGAGNMANHFEGNRGYQYAQYYNGRVIYWSGSTQISQIIKLARSFYFGAYSATNTFTPVGKVARTGIEKGAEYYMASDGTVTKVGTGNVYIGTWVATNVLYLIR